ncbi:MAG TPA: 3D domain-containing protein [Dissulfurispiraceae bacterium]|nr:3D domain-containing protein [Dissulfurispiraceae bacterium]
MYKLLFAVAMGLMVLMLKYSLGDSITVPQDDPVEKQVLSVVATAYSNDPISINVPKWRDGKTATMTPVRWGVVAVDPEIIPFGSRVFIEDMGWFSAEDTGSRIKGKRIDIFYPSRREAVRFGRKELTVLIEKT